MAPRKVGKIATEASSLQNPICTRKNAKRFVEDAGKDVKRKADVSPAKTLSKRSAFGDITNADLPKKSTYSMKEAKNGKSFVQPDKSKQNLQSHNLNKGLHSKPSLVTKKVSKIPTVKVSPLKLSSKESVQATTKLKEVKQKVEETELVKTVVLDDSGESLYVTAQEEPISSAEVKEVSPKLPAGVEDFDADNISDPFQVSHYVADIFNYLKSREENFKIESYMEKQTQITADMRELLVDWMVEMQESFELNHETLYLAVKLVDQYLSKVILPKETLQLVGITALFLACKYDERIPPQIEDFLYVCDGSYKQHELLSMEVKMLKAVNFELGIPLSYRFLRRYARCARVKMPTLTLARYILELSLMDYSFLTLSDSKLAAAALVLALMMEGQTYWNETLEYYSGFKLDDVKDFVVKLNNMLHNKPKRVSTIENKYSHEIFFQVAKQPVLQKVLW